MSKTTWTRCCQDCGHRQYAKNPDTYCSNSWRDVKCKKCQSTALDYGSANYVKLGKIWQDTRDEEKE